MPPTQFENMRWALETRLKYEVDLINRYNKDFFLKLADRCGVPLPPSALSSPKKKRLTEREVKKIVEAVWKKYVDYVFKKYGEERKRLLSPPRKTGK